LGLTAAFGRASFQAVSVSPRVFRHADALVYTEEDWRGGHAWQKFKQEWEAKGEKFDMAGVTPPPVPEDQNFALTPIVASSYEAMLDKAGHEMRPRNTNVVDRLSMITWRITLGKDSRIRWLAGFKKIRFKGVAGLLPFATADEFG